MVSVFTRPLLQLSFLAVLVSLAFSIQYLSAWTGPQSAPPTCVAGQIGCDAPINVGSTLQSKNGGLGVQTLDVTSDANIVGQLGFNATDPAYTIDMDALAEAATNGIRFPDGTVQVSAGGGGSQTLSFDDYLHVREQQASAVNSAGVVGNGVWGTRTLNTVVTNTISGASLATNRITLPTGTYYIDGYAEVVSGGRHRAQLYSVTAAATKIMGTSGYGRDDNNEDTTGSYIKGMFTVTGASEVFEIRHRSNDGGSNIASGYGVPEYYTPIEIWKLD